MSLTAERWDKAKALFAEAVAIAPAARQPWIAEACGDDAELAREIASLLSAHDAAGEFLSAPALADRGVAETMRLATASAAGYAAPERCGAYRILREYARGGMGVVYLAARADDQFEKQVAIKIVFSHMLPATVSYRFEEERRLLAMLDHPNVARLIDAGTTDNGLPYAVMEFIEGQPIDVFCVANRLTTRERVALVIKVCAAVQHAHQHLIVHRDIKPANVLVTDAGEPKLLDFGIAKLLDPAGVDARVTRTALRALTPEGASPEQVRGEAVTVLSDVYSLGVLLYRVLTDRGPYKGNLTGESAITRAVCDEEPLPPSRAVTASFPPDGHSAGTHRQRRRELRGDLDLITGKALSKEPSRRYASVNQLADDLQRHLDGRPIMAAPDAWTYRARKFVTRNWVAVAALTAVFTALAIGATTTWWQARRAERRFNDVRRLTHSFIFDVHDAIAPLPGSTAARQLLVATALEYLDDLSREAAGEPELQRELAGGYQKMADVLGRPSTPNLGDTKGALDSYRKSEALLVQLVEHDPRNVQARRDLSVVEQRLSRILFTAGDPPRAASAAEYSARIETALSSTDASADQAFRLARSVANHGYVLYVADRTVDSLAELHRAIAILERLDASGWNHAEVHNRLAVTYTYLALALRRGRPVTGVVPDLAASLAAQEKAVAIDRDFAASAHGDTAVLRQAMIDVINLGETYDEMGDLASAEKRYHDGIPLAEELAADKANLVARSDLVWALTLFGSALARDAQTDAALAALTRAEQIAQPLAASDTLNKTVGARVASLAEGFGYAHAALGADVRLTEAVRVQHWQQARTKFQQSYSYWQGLADKGTLTGADASRPAGLLHHIDGCDQALAFLAGKAR